MSSVLRFIAACSILLVSVSSVAAKPVDVKEIRLWNAPDHSRLVLDLGSSVSHKLMTLQNPERVVIDLKGAKKKTRFDTLDLAASPVKSIRSAVRNGSDLRIVLDMKQQVKPKSFLLAPNDQYGNRLVIDLYPKSAKSASKPVKKLDIVDGRRDVVVVVDPGHGGEDPGAIGPGKVREKDVVLAISKELVRQINAVQGYKAYLTRETDYYIGLRKRTEIARKRNADLFVSVHADAFTRAQANGASVYALSLRGASSETARWLAKKENASDLIGGSGVKLGDHDDMLASVLLDLSSTASLKASLSVGDKVLSSLGGVARLHKSQVQQAGFAVLKSPDIPSILVETGFISNPAESRRLKTQKYQRKIATSISTGVKRYFRETPPLGSWLASSQASSRAASYTVKRGDTLSHIAASYAVSVSQLRQLNKLRSDVLKVGQQLVLPRS
ncbi:N-acetylmuramoyl-L-alanine amidase [Oleiphilus sp. HI0071]|jgi:N-acetylmuramoyl-L-alanine amidase|uniref:N-acetylmuramoyl-L-alanine amidase n=2 Tax=Oleiphilus TaxID=141450 RepID=UPI0007C2E68E|nr:MULTISPECIES: N-acetylmuramoyl-L-alanine amidase [unclassified Oleiphilus]KZY71008.1 N-acetylmuramoyl-L-alanine amidase [Oleiphilus sp. HI0065]KZY81571.1 N-acetylmuramoyl-L-alanine amidase [Oleiphilus sp. HI0071]KZZ03744.1 N-acetylmuramoyl-L-alanine amidase [Oleiphilus sp. HI0073]KZZ40647.1 N-acetylmuramoyl-L-alanine amidase [Oleiphilus sp. HI0118]KZZ51778.1 N-acetylmuramoyl-L-alanine amidase [Oleiphilus sp. HI0122]KZZ66508.1 N-acetylmuramoyl-L-alanine amidase [Oleiphilus sp. HI0130]KZZ82